ncbi:MAG: nucleotide sugar dehydrogenase [Lysobacterales bacterium]
MALSLNLDQAKIGVVGLGYVGLPLAVEFGRQVPTIGFDVSQTRIDELQRGHDSTLEVDKVELSRAEHLTFTSSVDDLGGCSIFILTVPTPIDTNKQPDLTPLALACDLVAKVLTPGSLVIFESTVYPGATEEFCAPLLEEASGLKTNKDFFLGYSPERINPGDKEHRLPSIIKVTSGSTPEAADTVDQLYSKIITAGTHKTSSIRVAEAAKVIENTQRDLNIALINELALIFHELKIDTLEVLEAAGTKWNFLPFRPGLVGGHCISVDPYYLTHKALQVGYHPEVILAGRKLNDGMGAHVAGRTIKLMAENKIHVVESRVLVLGMTFKENCPDLRNSRVEDIVRELQTYNAQVDVHDPWVAADTAQSKTQGNYCEDPAEGDYDAIILAVAHKTFSDRGLKKLKRFGKPNHVFFDIKSVFPSDQVDGRL